MKVGKGEREEGREGGRERESFETESEGERRDENTREIFDGVRAK
jgi:hypothetical protein